jgi:CxxC motif-containing protein
MPEKREIICIMCPMGCLMTVTVSDNGDVLDVANNMCKEGEKYAIDECKFPGRILTTTLLTQVDSQPLLPAKSAKPVAKEKLIDCMRYLAETKVKPPIKMGQVVIRDIAGTGVDLVATDELQAKK